MKKVGNWKHISCASMPPVFADKVLCVVCGTATDEKHSQLRKSGFKCRGCVGKPHRPDVVTKALQSVPVQQAPPPSPSSRPPELKEAKRLATPVGIRPLSVCTCVTCSLQLHVPSGHSLLTCPNCKTVFNPYDRDARFMKCGSCRSLLQFSLSHARSSSVGSQPTVRCGRCDTPNYIPQMIVNPTLTTPVRPPILVSVSRDGDVMVSVERPKVENKTTPSIIRSLPVHKYKTPEKIKDRNSDTTECSFCLCEFEEGENLKTLPCFHMFHEAELDKWLEDHTECPLCKTSVL